MSKFMCIYNKNKNSNFNEFFNKVTKIDPKAEFIEYSDHNLLNHICYKYLDEIYPFKLDKKEDILIKKYLESSLKILPRGFTFKDLIQFEDENYDAYLEKFYSKIEILTVLERTFKYKFNQFYDLLKKSILHYFKGEYESAILLGITTLEGIIRSTTKKEQNFRGSYKQKLDTLFESYYSKFNFPNNFNFKQYDVNYLISNQYLNFLNDFIYKKSEEFDKKYPHETLNRHKIIHGLSTNYGTKENWLKVFLLIDNFIMIEYLEIFRKNPDIISVVEFFKVSNHYLANFYLSFIELDISNKINKILDLNNSLIWSEKILFIYEKLDLNFLNNSVYTFRYTKKMNLDQNNNFKNIEIISSDFDCNYEKKLVFIGRKDDVIMCEDYHIIIKI